MDLWSILLPIGYALMGYLASRMGVKIPMPGLPGPTPAQPAQPPTPATPATPATPDSPKPILDALKEVLPAMVSVAIAEVLKRLGISFPMQEQGKVDVMSFEAAVGESGLPVMSTVVNGFRFELVPRVSLVQPEQPAEPPPA
jgi:hypothetical protein